jgi:hypothetical protein
MTRRPIPHEILDTPSLEQQLAEMPGEPVHRRDEARHSKAEGGNGKDAPQLPAGVQDHLARANAARARRQADVKGALAMRKRLFGPKG